MSGIRFLFLFIITYSSVACSHSKLQTNIQSTGSICGKVKTSTEWSYCFTPGSGSNANKLIYYFHGGGGDEKGWLRPSNYPEGIREHWKKTGIDAPSVISVSFGPMWLLASRSENPKSGLYEVFKNEVVPYVETNLMKIKVEERIAIGESMGGFNAGTFALRNTDLFNKIALLCPAVGAENQSSLSDINKYIQETGAEKSYAKFLFKIRDEYFSSWSAAYSESPIKLVDNLSRKGKLPKFFLSCGDKDQYGFFHGAEQFVNILKSKEIDVVWSPEAGGSHCSLNLIELNIFLNQTE